MMFPLFSKKEKFLLEKFNVPRCCFSLWNFERILKRLFSQPTNRCHLCLAVVMFEVCFRFNLTCLTKLKRNLFFMSGIQSVN